MKKSHNIKYSHLANIGHPLIKENDMQKIRHHVINDFAYQPVKKTSDILFNKVKNNEINKTEFSLLCTYLFNPE